MTSGAIDVSDSTAERPLSVLHAHNFYRSTAPSGENDTVVLLTRAWAGAGATVTPFYLSSDMLAAMPKTALLKIATRPLGRPNHEFRTILDDLSPDALVVHNLHPQMSPSDLRYAQRIGVPVVHVVHNYRHSCLAGTHFRGGQACTSCSMRRFANPGVRRRCYRGSMAQSLVLAASNGMYHALWRDLDAYIAISPRIAKYLVTEGFPSHRIHVISNPIVQIAAPAAAGTGVLYAGRLEREKGVEILLDAWRILPAELRKDHLLHVAGQGALCDLVRDRSRSDSTIRFHGFLGSSALNSVASECGVTVIPSIWEEPFGRAAAESLMRGHALVVTNRGALADIVAAGAGWVVEPRAQAISEGLIAALEGDNRVRAERGQALAVSRYGLESVGRSYLEVFRSIASRDRST